MSLLEVGSLFPSALFVCDISWNDKIMLVWTNTDKKMQGGDCYGILFYVPASLHVLEIWS